MRQGYPAASRVDVRQGFRRADAAALTSALQASRDDTLATFAAIEREVEALRVPQRDTLNPPLWELGHIGWFQEWWIARNPQRARGAAADPDAPRAAPLRDIADALYDSSRVAHATRWSLALPDANATRDDLARQLEATLAILNEAGTDDAALYFFRLVLAHEDMHHEAALYMAQALGIPIDDARWQPASLPDANPPLQLAAGPKSIGAERPGFQFDNEIGAHEIVASATIIDRRVVRWSEFLPFVEGGAYRHGASWTDAGREWLAATRPEAPRYLRRIDDEWQCRRHGAWTPLDPSQAACHLTLHEAEAWCRWAGRRLPTETEWEQAALTGAPDFRWGDVWEWTASAFLPYPGFMTHPYRDYSAPWFETRTVLRGASFMTQPRMRDPRYRNFFPGDRNDVAAGFRTCRR